MQPNMTDPFKPTKADWEEMRQWVANQDKDGDSLERRVGRLEANFSTLNTTASREIAGLTAVVDNLVGVLSNLVTRDQLQAERTKINGLWICAAVLVVVWLFRR